MTIHFEIYFCRNIQIVTERPDDNFNDNFNDNTEFKKKNDNEILEILLCFPYKMSAANITLREIKVLVRAFKITFC